MFRATRAIAIRRRRSGLGLTHRTGVMNHQYSVHFEMTCSEFNLQVAFLSHEQTKV